MRITARLIRHRIEVQEMDLTVEAPEDFHQWDAEKQQRALSLLYRVEQGTSVGDWSTDWAATRIEEGTHDVLDEQFEEHAFFHILEHDPHVGVQFVDKPDAYEDAY